MVSKFEIPGDSMGMQINQLMSILCVTFIGYPNCGAYNKSYVLSRKPSVKQLSQQIIQVSVKGLLLTSDHWCQVRSWWFELVRYLTPAIRSQMRRYIEAGNTIFSDGSWIREHCLEDSAVAHAAYEYRDSVVKPASEHETYKYQAAQMRCLNHSVIVMVLHGVHKEISLDYFDNPGVCGFEQCSGDALYVQRAYQALWTCILQELHRLLHDDSV